MDTINWFKGKWAFLSNFYPSPLHWERIYFPTAEHAYNAAKTLDPFQRMVISMAPTPAAAKKLGRAAAMQPDWETKIRYQAMGEILREKFSGPSREAALLGTGRAMLIEGNYWHDQVWGNCMCNRPECREPGQNNLGYMLMEIREELRHV